MTSIRRNASLFAGLVLVLGLAVAGCKGTTPIKDVLDDPARFDGETVRIAGTVTSATGLLGTGIYNVDDGTGKITVVSKSGGVPREGAKVGVEGSVKNGYTIGSSSLTVLMETKRKSE
jgi:hypothetical protein